ncbi:phasin family protein [Novosphingobium sp. FGD1]|uniref:Phasin family protein n=1 Tax=Novosphingobium silvae TaxID=2692619 RepID=A0A7X4K734_9SPHN|nr:phasin family protein [Novosphingobium silvae]MYL98661.1 phasin family protein [Novosphingobium silvae]
MADNEDTKDTKNRAAAAATKPAVLPGIPTQSAAKAPETPKPGAFKATAGAPPSVPAQVVEAAKAVAGSAAKGASAAPEIGGGKQKLIKPRAAPGIAKPAVAEPKASEAAAVPQVKSSAPAGQVASPSSSPAEPAKDDAEDVKAAALPNPAPAAASYAEPSPAIDTQPTTGTKPAFAGLFTNFMLEEHNMDMSNNFAGIQDAMTEAQAKAKAAFDKSTSVLGEVSEFAKGNVEAVVESGKIMVEGMQGFGSELVAEGRTAFETMTGDIKELAAAKSPTDFFKIQGDMVRKNFDSAVAYSSKNSEAMLKLFSDSFAPISGRMSVAMEKARSVSV